MLTPSFAVVGHPNKGKSSIVATLAQDDSVYIDRVSGSTKRASSFPMSIDGQVLYELVDTPGFQRARATLAWLTENCQSASKRKETINAFFQQKKEDIDFINECELLKPIINGAAIIYVVDGSRPYGPEYETEMEILRWTGAPSLALINPIDSGDYIEEWKNALGQYFDVVRIFDAHRAEFSKRISLLTLFGQLLQEWHEPLETAVSALTEERNYQHRQASELITNMLVDIVQHSESQKVLEGMGTELVEIALEKKYLSFIRKSEKRCRQLVEKNYAYVRLARNEDELILLDTDLVDQNYWYLFGLNKQQLVAAAAGTGAGAGALVDAGFGGSSLLLGTLLGGMVGATGALSFSRQIAKLSISGLPTGGKTIQYGPASHPNFPFVVLGRALRHHDLIARRTHANRSDLSISKNSPLKDVSASDRIRLMSVFKDIRKHRNVLNRRNQLTQIVIDYLRLADKEEQNQQQESSDMKHPEDSQQQSTLEDD